MEMIDVLKRLAELDAGNPNVENKMNSVESLMTVSNVDGEIAKINEDIETVDECGPMGVGPSMAPRTPASINMTASSGEELAGMLRDIMSLAGVNKSPEADHKEIELMPAGAAEPDHSDMMSTIKMIDSMNSPEEEFQEEPEEEALEGIEDRMYDNSPEEEIEAHDYGDKQVKPKPQGLKQRVGDNPYTPARESIESLANRLLSELHEYIAEGKPSAGLSKEKKSETVKKAKAGKDIGKKGKGFKAVADKAAKKYGSKEKGEKVAAAAMWKNIKR